MPTREYVRSDGTTFERLEKMDAPRLERCPDTGLEVERLISTPRAHFKGPGFHANDYEKMGPKVLRKRDLKATYKLSRKNRKAAKASNIPAKD